MGTVAPMSHVSVEHITVHIDDLVYATSALAVARVLRRTRGVVRVSVDLAGRQVQLAVSPDTGDGRDWKHALAALGLPVVESHARDTRREFTARGSIILAFTLVMASGLFRHSGILTPPPELPSFPLLSALEALVLAGAGYPYYRQALALLVQREYNLGVLIAGMSWVFFLAGATLAEVGGGPVVGWLTWTLLLASMALAAGWFLVRGCALWLSPRPGAGIRQIEQVSRNSTGG